MSNPTITINDFIGVTCGEDDWLRFTVTAYNETDRSLMVRIDAMGNDGWKRHTRWRDGKEYRFVRHFNSDEAPFDRYDPMELWEWLRPGQKEHETILPQILLYFWHDQQLLSMEWDF